MNNVTKDIFIVLIILLAFQTISVSKTFMHERVHERICKYLGGVPEGGKGVQVNLLTAEGSYPHCSYSNSEVERVAAYLDAQNEVNSYYAGIYLVATLFLSLLVAINIFCRIELQDELLSYL